MKNTIEKLKRIWDAIDDSEIFSNILLIFINLCCCYTTVTRFMHGQSIAGVIFTLLTVIIVRNSILVTINDWHEFEKEIWTIRDKIKDRFRS